MSWEATAGNSIGIYCTEVPSYLTAPVAITLSPTLVKSCIAPDVPILTKVLAPILANSSTAIAVEGHPIPVEVTDTDLPLYFPVIVLYSLLWATTSAVSKWLAIVSTLPGSPGNMTKSATSPSFIWMWYWTSLFKRPPFSLLLMIYILFHIIYTF